MAEMNLGRVQGAGYFYTSSSCTTATTSITKSTLTPADINPLVGDKILSPEGLLFNITATGDTLTVVYISDLHGVNGVDGQNSVATLNGETATGVNIYAPTDSGTADQFLVSSGKNVAPQWVKIPQYIHFLRIRYDAGTISRSALNMTFTSTRKTPMTMQDFIDMIVNASANTVSLNGCPNFGATGNYMEDSSGSSLPIYGMRYISGTTPSDFKVYLYVGDGYNNIHSVCLFEDYEAFDLFYDTVTELTIE